MRNPSPGRQGRLVWSDVSLNSVGWGRSFFFLFGPILFVLSQFGGGEMTIASEDHHSGSVPITQPRAVHPERIDVLGMFLGLFDGCFVSLPFPLVVTTTGRGQRT